MKLKIAAVLLSGLAFGCVQPPPPAANAPPAPAPAAAPAPPPGDRVVNIRGALCDKFLELSEEDREMATMFYIGYQASRIGARTINVLSVPSITSLSTNYCLNHRNRPVAEAFAVGYRSFLRYTRGS